MTRFAIAAVCLLAASCSGAPPVDSQMVGDAALQPQDFAQGMTLTTSSDDAFFRVALPDVAYTGTAWPDLRDVRVFNAAGESVPFARVSPPPREASRRQVALRTFRLESVQPGAASHIEFDAQANGVALRVSPTESSTNVEYLLAVEDDRLEGSIDRLYFEWPEREDNWRQTVTVATSSDLEHWRIVAAARPLVDVRTSDGERLRQNVVHVVPAIPESARYWRLQFDAGTPPALSSVTGEIATAAPAEPGVVIVADTHIEAAGPVVYKLPSPQPIAHVRIVPVAVNSVLPILVETRAAADRPWESTARMVTYRLATPDGEQFADPLPLGNRTIEAVRLSPLGSSWGATPPDVRIEREPLLLVANARGAGPFLLAWGSRVAAESAIAFTDLVPGHTPGDVLQIPEASPDSLQQLGGPSRLTELTVSERAARWQTGLVWILLVGGVGLLALLAYRVWREARAGTVRTDAS